jgi:hypothetical protein
MMQKIIARLRAKCPVFETRVYGSGSYEKLLERVASGMPYAVVTPIEDASTLVGQGGSLFIRHIINQKIAVSVVISNADDLRGEKPALSVYGIRDQLIAALCGGKLSSDHDPIQYDGYEILSMDRAALMCRFDFSSKKECSSEVFLIGEQESLGDFDTMNITDTATINVNGG